MKQPLQSASRGACFPAWCPPGWTCAGTGRWTHCRCPLPIEKAPWVDNLFLFICSNLSSDQAGSPLIISVIPLHKSVQWSSVFLKITVPEIKLKKEEILFSSQGLAGVLTRRSHRLCWLSSCAQNHKRTFCGKFWREFRWEVQVGRLRRKPTWSPQLRRTLKEREADE